MTTKKKKTPYLKTKSPTRNKSLDNVKSIIEKKTKKTSINKQYCKVCHKDIDGYCICWRSHPNSKFNSKTWDNIIELIKKDVYTDHALAFEKVEIGTFYHRINKDKNLFEEYQKAKNRMNIVTSNVIANRIVDDNDDKLAFERKKRRDPRYRDKVETISDNTTEIKISQDDQNKIDTILNITNE